MYCEIQFLSECCIEDMKFSAVLIMFFVCFYFYWSTWFKGELRPEISLLHMKVLTLIKAKSNVFLWYVQCCRCTRRLKTKILMIRATPSWIEFDVVLNRLLETLKWFFWLLQEINKRRNMEINNHKSFKMLCLTVRRYNVKTQSKMAAP